MINEIELGNVLFLDIETVPQYANYLDLPEKEREFWNHKSAYLDKNKSALQLYSRAGIYAEFGKIVCISVGYVVEEKKERKIRIKSFYGVDEIDILNHFKLMIEKWGKKDRSWLCAHNGKEFDYPFIARRMLINGIKVPELLDLRGKKPWEVQHFDTLELWRFGDYKHYTSLDLLCHLFKIPTPKDQLDGSKVGFTYWVEKDIKKIANYCQKDVVATIQLFLRYKSEELIPEWNIELVK